MGNSSTLKGVAGGSRQKYDRLKEAKKNFSSVCSTVKRMSTMALFKT